MHIKSVGKKICPQCLQKTATSIFREGRLLKHRIKAAKTKDTMKWYCPCCGLKIHSFVAADYLDNEHFNPDRYKNARQDVLCPACMSLPRHRIFASWLNEHKEVLIDKKILYFAPEYSMSLWLKMNGIRCTTADILKGADLQLDIQDTGLSDESYDVVVCNHVLEHVDDFRKALREVYRVLRPGGTFICSFPMDKNVDIVDEDKTVQSDEGRYKRYGQADHKRIFGMNADKLLTEAGFVVERIKGEQYLDEILPVIGPADYDMNMLFYCEKR